VSSFGHRNNDGQCHFYYSTCGGGSGSGIGAIATAAISTWAALLCCQHGGGADSSDQEDDSGALIRVPSSLSSSSSSLSSSSLLPSLCQRWKVARWSSAIPTSTCIDDQASFSVDRVRPLWSVLSFCMDTFMALSKRIIDQHLHHGWNEVIVCRCEALTRKSNTVETSNNVVNSMNKSRSRSRNSSAADEKWNMDDSSLYERMKLPDRALLSSHVVYGQLLQKGLVESYKVYRRLKQHERADADVEALPIVVAAISLGKSLNGHDGIVHGGILALLVDDVLGFGYQTFDDIALAVTANLAIDFRTPCPESSDIMIAAYLLQRKGRKLVWKVRVTSPDQTILYCEATSVYVIPKEKQRAAVVKG
jgi:acyl-coenzyme A thioesterase PaaI-like protein